MHKLHLPVSLSSVRSSGSRRAVNLENVSVVLASSVSAMGFRRKVSDSFRRAVEVFITTAYTGTIAPDPGKGKRWEQEKTNYYSDKVSILLSVWASIVQALSESTFLAPLHLRFTKSALQHCSGFNPNPHPGRTENEHA